MTTIVSSVVALLLVGIIFWLVNTRNQAPTAIRTAVNVVVGLIVVGIVLWLINNYIPMAGNIKTILNIFVFIATCVGVLRAVGLWNEIVSLWSNLRSHRLPH